MKYPLLIFVILLSHLGTAQNPDLFGTWYLQGYQLSGGGYFPVPETNPQIAPFIRFIDTANAENSDGDGGCNLFTANLVYDPQESLYEFDVFTTSSNFCADPVGTDYEDSMYLYFFQEGSMYHYAFYTDNDGNTVLVIQNQFLDFAEFKNVPLAVSEVATLNFTAYPNPVADKLFIFSESNLAEKLSVYTISGQKVIEISQNTNSIDVSGLSEGLYFLEIHTSEGISVQKFIKK
ncbi:putative secreted protein (Por secretion system target) [Ulvibacter sp. MAR_2010_11]|uniref:T9SS type A sorting domain-containing protein n=1 Tax=Ulvibacter sp. MAR_2010_11 TaxID=1250229 RepID=UPI000CB50789|nr:T9SS type A sorting domain-containing protein [Ulvibacter sp. MAR_2010_11]PKA83137.1 putative secreted protein (Por secretion system target) [Ulvibacter sp. MAR_2010_11]